MKKRHWDAVIERMQSDKALIGAEIGVYRGQFSRAVLKAMPKLTLHLIDRWQVYPENEREEGRTKNRTKGSMDLFDEKDWESIYKEARQRIKPFSDRAVIHRLCSEDASKLFEDKYFDFVFIDADHRYEAVIKDIEYWIPKVKSKGYICGHDYPSRPGVLKAVNEAFPSEMLETGYNLTWFIQIDL